MDASGQFTPAEEAKLIEGVEKGKRAFSILNDPLFAEIVRETEVTFTREWRTSTELADREAAWTKIQVLDKVIQQLRVKIGTGELAAKSLEVAARRQRMA